jgi:hypothetical protein
MGERRDAYRVLVGKPKGKGPLGKPKRILQEILTSQEGICSVESLVRLR